MKSVVNIFARTGYDLMIQVGSCTAVTGPVCSGPQREVQWPQAGYSSNKWPGALAARILVVMMKCLIRHRTKGIISFGIRYGVVVGFHNNNAKQWATVQGKC